MQALKFTPPTLAYSHTFVYKAVFDWWMLFSHAFNGGEFTILFVLVVYTLVGFVSGPWNFIMNFVLLRWVFPC